MLLYGDQSLLKRINRIALVRLVRSKPGMSRADLAQTTGLTKSTISFLVQELIAEHWLREDSVQASRILGRRPTPLRIDGRRLVLVGAELGPRGLRVVSVGLDGCIIDQAQFDGAGKLSAQERLRQLTAMLGVQIASCTANGYHVLGLGLGLEEELDASSQNAHQPEELLTSGLDVRGYLESRINVPLMIQRASHAAAMGEVEFSGEQSADSLLYVSLSPEVSVGVVANGRLMSGAHGAAGRVAVLANHKGVSALVNTQDFAVLAGQGAQAAGACIAALIDDLCAVVDPATVVLGGAVGRLGAPLLEAVSQSLDQLMEGSQQKPLVRAAQFGDYAVPVGAAALVLHRLLTPN